MATELEEIEKLQGISFSQLKSQVNIIHHKNEKLSTDFEATKNDDIINKDVLITRTKGVNERIPFIE